MVYTLEKNKVIQDYKMVTVYATDKKIPFNKMFLQKLDLMIDRVTQKNPKLDAVFQNEGGEGLGKTSFSVAQYYYIAWKTKKKFTHKNVFFDVGKAIEYAQSTEGEIIVFDEPATAVLKVQWRNKIQQDLITLLMLARKKRHFIIFNFVKFYRFNEYIVVDRCLGMAHLYERKDRKGYAFAYIPRGNLESLYNDAIKKHYRNYFKYSIFTGEFPDVLNPEKKYNLLDLFDVEEYEKEKDKAILNIGKSPKKETSPERKDLLKLKKLVGSLKPPIKTKTELAEKLGLDTKTLWAWGKIPDNDIE